MPDALFLRSARGVFQLRHAEPQSGGSARGDPNRLRDPRAVRNHQRARLRHETLRPGDRPGRQAASDRVEGQVRIEGHHRPLRRRSPPAGGRGDHDGRAHHVSTVLGGIAARRRTASGAARQDARRSSQQGRDPRRRHERASSCRFPLSRSNGPFDRPRPHRRELDGAGRPEPVHHSHRGRRRQRARGPAGLFRGPACRQPARRGDGARVPRRRL